MRFAAYVILLFSISLTLYFLGYTNLLTAYSNSNAPLSMSALINSMVENIINPSSLFLAAGMALALIAGVIAILTGQSNFSVMFIIPAIILAFSLTYLLAPLSFILDPSLPVILKLMLSVFFNILTVLSAISFVRGGV